MNEYPLEVFLADRKDRWRKNMGVGCNASGV